MTLPAAGVKSRISAAGEECRIIGRAYTPRQNNFAITLERFIEFGISEFIKAWIASRRIASDNGYCQQ